MTQRRDRGVQIKEGERKEGFQTASQSSEFKDCDFRDLHGLQGAMYTRYGVCREDGAAGSRWFWSAVYFDQAPCLIRDQFQRRETEV